MEAIDHRSIIKTSIPSTVMLCEHCKTAISSIRSFSPGFCNGSEPSLFGYAEGEDTWRGAHHTEHGTFLSAVNARCYICYTLHQACPTETRQYADFFLTFYEIWSQGDDQYELQFAIELHQNSPLVEIKSQVIEPYGTFKILPKAIIPNIGSNLKLTANTFTGQCEKQIRSWLTECGGTHLSCIEDWRTGFDYPIRLLNVSTSLGNCVRLETFNNGSRRNPYVTMSHCWDHGPEVHSVKLTTQSIQQLESGFPISELPGKFRDAIVIAQWMKVDYLWIDALCIVQDSRVDWQHQSSLMGDIYAGSYCNIAATNIGHEQGCFVNRPVEVVEPYFIPNPSSPSTENTHMIGYDDFWCNSLLDTALHKRAWVLQERLLSPRTIHFGKEQMFWECRKHKACESYPSGVPPEFCNRRTNAWRQGEDWFKPKVQQSFLTSFLKLFVSRQSTRSVPLERVYKFWSTTVERYMDCSLSVASDKLVAIAGIASKVQDMTGERYLAGLWENSHLAQSLLWYVPFREQANGRASMKSPPMGEPGYRAPSWSWASLDAKIVWTSAAQCDEILIEVEHTDIQVSGGDASAIQSASMKVRGRLTAVQLQIIHTNEDGTLKEDGSYALIPKETKDSAVGVGLLPELQPHEEPVVYLDTALCPASTAEVYLLPICTKWRNREGSIAGLILQQRRSQEAVSYERMGVFCLDRSQAHIVGGSSERGNGATIAKASMKSVVLV